MIKHGYCWFEPLFDWSRLRFSPHYTDRVLFGNSILHGQYLRHRAELQDFLSSIQKLEMALGWLKQHNQNPAIRSRLKSWIVHICLQQFRSDILHRVRKSVREHKIEEALKGEQPFCMQYFREIMVEKLHVISGNRCEIKIVSDLAHLLFDFDDGLLRTHWEDLPFRKIYRRATIGLDPMEAGGEPSSQLSKLLRRKLWSSLLSHHWILPYPNRDTIMQRTKDGKLMWYSIIARKEEQTLSEQIPRRTRGCANPEDERGRHSKELVRRRKEEHIGDYHWVWGRKSWQAGKPKTIPMWVWWEQKQWLQWIEHSSTAS